MIHVFCDAPAVWSERFRIRGECSATTPAIIGLTGISGSGKTTLLRIIAGLERQDDAVPTHVEFSGALWQHTKVQGALDAFPEALQQSTSTFVQPEQRPVGMVFQQPELFPTMTVLENIRFALPKVFPEILHIQSEQNFLDEIIEITHIREFLRRKSHQLSGGQQKRVALARGLARCADLLLLDEPTIGLDHKSGEHLIESVISYCRKHKRTMIVATHDGHLLHDIDTEWRIAHGRVKVR